MILREYIQLNCRNCNILIAIIVTVFLAVLLQLSFDYCLSIVLHLSFSFMSCGCPSIVIYLVRKRFVYCWTSVAKPWPSMLWQLAFADPHWIGQCSDCASRNQLFASDGQCLLLQRVDNIVLLLRLASVSSQFVILRLRYAVKYLIATINCLFSRNTSMPVATSIESRLCSAVVATTLIIGRSISILHVGTYYVYLLYTI